MSGIQFILLTGIAFISLYFLTRTKKNIIDLLVLGTMILCAIIFILQPELTQKVAHRLGVGRGADLVFYLSILIFWFVVLKLYSRVRRLEQTLTELVRQNTLKDAEKHQ